MNDADPTATGYPPREESAPHDMSVPDPNTPEFHETAGDGEQGYQYPAQPGPGGAGAWPSWPGVARPAGWFLEAAGEAAPLAATSPEPARPDHPQYPDHPRHDDEEDAAGYPSSWREPVAGPAGARYDDEEDAAGYPSSWREPVAGPAGARYDDEEDAAGYPSSWREPVAGPAGALLDDQEDAVIGYPAPRREPVVGPTEALRGRAGGPGFRVPAGAGYGVQDPANRSGWQVADGLWRESGISWEDEEPRRQAFPLSAPVADAPARPESFAPSAASPATPSASPPAVPPAADDLPRRQAAPLRPDALPQPQYRAQQDHQPRPPRQDYQAHQLRQPRQDYQPRQVYQPQRDYPGRQGWSGGPRAADRHPMADGHPAADGHPVAAGYPAADRWQPPGPRPRQRAEWQEPQQLQEPQHLREPQQLQEREPWQEQEPWEDQGVPAFPARRPARGRKAWQVARVGVPVGVIVAVGAGALVMLTGKTHEVLARTGSQSPASLAPAGAHAAGNGGAGTRPAPLAFPGYPGQQGAEAVNSIASAGGVQIAVGTADGRAAIWRRVNGGAWSLLKGASVVTQAPAGATLTSVTHGPAGWLAVGDVAPVPFGNSGTAKAPIVLASADGGTWQAITGNAAFSGPGFQVNAAAANGSGYVVVGSQLKAGKPFGTSWWSPDLRNWVRGDDTIMTTLSAAGSGMKDSAMYAVAATPAGFVAVGTHADCHTAWVSADGQHWRSFDIPKATGTQFPLLNHVAATGNLVVATGDIGVNGQRYPLAVTSSDGGLHWRGSTLGGSATYAGPHGTVTALAADGSGFLAAGLVGQQGGQQAVTWTSPDGITWSASRPASSGTAAITALAAEGSAVTQISTLTAAYGYRSVAVTAAGS